MAERYAGRDGDETEGRKMTTTPARRALKRRSNAIKVKAGIARKIGRPTNQSRAKRLI
jgi:hypothetical protein